jgi:hypothetical protein
MELDRTVKREIKDLSEVERNGNPKGKTDSKPAARGR